MAFDPKPPTWLPGWSEDGTNITLPIASLPELTAAEADADTGDIRKVMYALMSKMQAVWDALPSADRPTRMTLYHTASVDPTSGIITHSFTATFKNSVSAQDVADEPA